MRDKERATIGGMADAWNPDKYHADIQKNVSFLSMEGHVRKCYQLMLLGRGSGQS